MNRAEIPDQLELHRLFNYDPLTGELTWKPRQENKSWDTRYAGTPALASKNKKGYRYGKLNGVTVRAHRVIYKLLHGVDPDQVDHENGVRDDNRAKNLRDVSNVENQRNMKTRSDNESGHMGVQYRTDIDKWRAYINVDTKQINLGCFPTFDEAVAVRQAAEIQHNFHPNHGRTP